MILTGMVGLDPSQRDRNGGHQLGIPLMAWEVNVSTGRNALGRRLAGAVGSEKARDRKQEVVDDEAPGEERDAAAR